MFHWLTPRLISVVDVVITPMNPSIPTNTIPHLIFYRIPVQNFNLCWLKHLCDEIAEEEKVFERNDRFSQKKSFNIDNYKIKHIYMNKYHISSDFISLADTSIMKTVLCCCCCIFFVLFFITFISQYRSLYISNLYKIHICIYTILNI